VHVIHATGENDFNLPAAVAELGRLLGVPRQRQVLLANDFDHVFLPHELVRPIYAIRGPRRPGPV